MWRTRRHAITMLASIMSVVLPLQPLVEVRALVGNSGRNIEYSPKPLARWLASCRTPAKSAVLSHNSYEQGQADRNDNADICLSIVAAEGSFRRT